MHNTLLVTFNYVESLNLFSIYGLQNGSFVVNETVNIFETEFFYNRDIRKLKLKTYSQTYKGYAGEQKRSFLAFSSSN